MYKTALLIATLILFFIAGCAMSNTPDTERNMEKTSVTLINTFIVPNEKLDETILMWEQARDYLQTQPGYISTSLHQSVSPEAKFQLINVAKWESPQAFMTATKKMNAEANLPRIEGVIPNPSLYKVIRED